MCTIAMTSQTQVKGPLQIQSKVGDWGSSDNLGIDISNLLLSEFSTEFLCLVLKFKVLYARQRGQNVGFLE